MKEPKLDSLPGTQKCGLQDQQMWKTEAGQVLLPVAGVYWDSPVRQFLPLDGRRVGRTVSFFLVDVCTAEVVQRHSTHTCTAASQ